MNHMLETHYGIVKKEVVQRATQIRLLICDVDGVLSDGRIYMGNQGEELKSFHIHDGHGIRCLKNAGIEVALITGRSSQIVKDRALTLGIDHLYQGAIEKLIPYRELLSVLSLNDQQVAYIGDDLIDWPVMQKVGLSVAVSNAYPWLLKKAHYVTYTLGGHGAVRELCDLILLAQKKLTSAKEAFI
ncbi:MAG: 3-deoxy-manno-octulosonate-8-phosphatase KdsC [Candidatus Hamiltonella defensa (Ceratovacuna japonica)]